MEPEEIRRNNGRRIIAMSILWGNCGAQGEPCSTPGQAIEVWNQRGSMMSIAINRIIDGLNEMEKRIESIEKEFECNCVENMNRGGDDYMVSHWFCPKHGRQGL